MWHILGFNKNLYGSWVNGNGIPIGEEKVFKLRVTKYRGYVQSKNLGNNEGIKVARQRFQILTPKVIEKAKDHFKCDQIAQDLGVFLSTSSRSEFDSNQLSHWDRKMILNDGMTMSTMNIPMKFTSLSFAVLEDTGWYKVDYSLAEEVEWGKDAGCDFYLLACYEGKKDYNKKFFCFGDQVTCNHERTHKAKCEMNEYMDICKYREAQKSCTELPSQAGPDRIPNEVYGFNSKCFNTLDRDNAASPKCFEYSCNLIKKWKLKLNIKIKSIPSNLISLLLD